MTDTAPSPMANLTHDDITAIIQRSCEIGFRGWGGACTMAAVALNRVLFDGKGLLVGAFNAPLFDKGQLLGHAAVEVDGIVWDADARPKTTEGDDDILNWGMLDFEDPDYAEIYKSCGLAWTEDAADDAGIYDFETEQDLMDAAGKSFDQAAVTAFEIALVRACWEITGRDTFPAASAEARAALAKDLTSCPS